MAIRRLVVWLGIWVIAGWIGVITPSAFIQPEYEDFSVYPWYYLRGGMELSDREDLATIFAVGDLILGRQVFSDLNLFEKTPWLANADLVIGNFESSLAKNEEEWKKGLSEEFQSIYEQCLGNHPYKYYDPIFPSQKPITLIAPPWAPIILRKAGFDLLNLANNHAFDSSELRLIDQVQRFTQIGIGIIGVGPTNQEAIQPVIREIRGVKIAVIAFTMISPAKERSIHAEDWIVANWQREAVLQEIVAAHRSNDVVIVFPHWGEEYSRIANAWQQRIARELTLAGADLVIGHHPHVVQPTYIWSDEDRERMVAFSLGNFVSDQCEPDSRKGLVLQIFVDKKGLRAIRAMPVNSINYPELQTTQEDIEWLEKFRSPDKRIFFQCSYDRCSEVDVLESNSERTSIFIGHNWTGQIDLTGDGQLETIIRTAGRIIVYENGFEVWKSPPEWQVVDFALGDPNQDGRNEILIALNKLDSAGVLQSHPFIVGYRGGSYKLLWGGSAVSEKILEVEIGDIDSDLDHEILVIESHPSNKRTVSLWRWHGWGFRLEWRSSYAYYRRLRLYEHDGNMLFSVDLPHGRINIP